MMMVMMKMMVPVITAQQQVFITYTTDNTTQHNTAQHKPAWS
jgi:hypothetical protein